MSKKEQTAVEWLVGQLQKSKDFQRVINEVNQSSTSVRNVLDQAKEMEREQSIEFAWECQEMFKHEIKEHFEEKFNDGGSK
jgi:hypothetical protein